MPISIAKSCALGAIAASTSACMAATAPPAESSLASDRQCFRASQVRGFHAVDDDTVHVMVGPNDVYSLEIIGVCPMIDWQQRIAIRSHASSSWVCSGYNAELIVPSPTGPNSCAVTGVTRMSEEEARAIREAHD